MKDYYYVTVHDAKGVQDYCPSHRDSFDEALATVEHEQWLDSEIGVAGMVYTIAPRKRNSP